MALKGRRSKAALSEGRLPVKSRQDRALAVEEGLRVTKPSGTRTQSK